MTTWTEAQIDRHLHLWEHRHGPDSPEAGIVRQLRAERDAKIKALESVNRSATYPVCSSINPRGFDIMPATKDRLEFIAETARAALPTTQETPHD